MSEDDFMRWKTKHIFSIFDQFIGKCRPFCKNTANWIAVFLIIFGVSILWDNLRGLIMWLLPDTVANVLINLFYNVPSIIIMAILLLLASTCLIQRSRSLTAKRLQKTPEGRTLPGSLIVLISSPEETAEVSHWNTNAGTSESIVVLEKSSTDTSSAHRQLLSPQICSGFEEVAGTEKTNWPPECLHNPDQL